MTDTLRRFLLPLTLLYLLLRCVWCFPLGVWLQYRWERRDAIAARVPDVAAAAGRDRRVARVCHGAADLAVVVIIIWLLLAGYLGGVTGLIIAHLITGDE